LNAGVAVHGVVDELTAAEIHSCVSDFGSAGSEKQQIARLKIHTLDCGRTTPDGLRGSITRHHDSALPHQHLGKSGAIESKAGDAAPGVCDAEKSTRQLEGFVDAQQ
jgi:hypothetical protein